MTILRITNRLPLAWALQKGHLPVNVNQKPQTDLWVAAAIDAYTAYGRTVEFKAYDGSDLACWEDLQEAQKLAWAEVARVSYKTYAKIVEVVPVKDPILSSVRGRTAIMSSTLIILLGIGCQYIPVLASLNQNLIQTVIVSLSLIASALILGRSLRNGKVS